MGIKPYSNSLRKPKFKYFGMGYWRGVDKLGRTSGFYTWKMLWKRYDKIIKDIETKGEE